MNYSYYPGCSLEGTAKEYDLSTRAVLEALGVTLTELEDWTCCGATAAEPISGLLSISLSAINLAIAEKVEGDLLVPCSACYLNLKKALVKTGEDPKLLEKVNTVLNEKGLVFGGKGNVRHVLDVLSRDIGAEKVAGLVKNRFEGLVVAPYYGCQCLRPYPEFDDPETPRSMEPLIEATGAAVHEWRMGAACCGASNMNTKTEAAVQLVADILEEAKGADAIVTVCPMCQINLEAYQKQASAARNKELSITILYLPQLLGLAFGIPEKTLGIDLNLAVSSKFRNKIKKAA